ncbi:cholecystokinin receptor type A isoform X2 [Anguilla anguilla]|uniref:cholecystokinin receptor type A isoform X2 n=1 Tax=Anguilla anguilla TaxID=7936 RepID=UPI0015AD82C7|nr:cholecystokinin receptor type A isoform X2 [Anguilla anguilla]
METFTLPDIFRNSTDIYKLLCGLGIKNDSDCDNGMDFTQEPKDINQTVRIFLYVLIFLLSILGNSLIITVLVRNGRMRTVTNLFLLSLAASDLMLCVFCMPFTLIPNLMKDFIFSSGICKGAMYFMGVSVSVSTFNLVAISLERYSAICNPLTSRTWQTKSHAAKVITATWVVSFILMLPYPIASTLVPFTRYNNSTGNMCRLVWPSDIIQQSWYVFLLLLLFLVPGLVMMTAYGLISLELYKGIKFEMNNRKSNRERGASTNGLRPADGDGCYLQPSKRKAELQQLQAQRSQRQGSDAGGGSVSAGGGSSKAKLSRVSSNSSATNLMAKKRVIRMLLVIVCLFFLCWTPIFSVNAWRAFHRRSADRLLSGAPISFIHLLSYTSACVNPIIYCFMNKRFRQGMLATFACCSPRGGGGVRRGAGPRARRANGCLCRGPGPEEDGHTHSGGTLTRFTYSSTRGSAQA